MTVHAGQKPANVPEGYKAVSLQNGGYILVKKQKDPLQNVNTASSTPGKYDPSVLFSGENTMAQKKFDFGPNAGAKNEFNLTAQEKSNGLSKPFFAGGQSQTASDSVPNLNTKAPVSSTNAFSRHASGYEQSYATTGSDLGGSKSSKYPTATAADQGRTSELSDKKAPTFTSADSGKVDQDAFPLDTGKPSDSLIKLKDLPNRPLTIDEVRNLINHGVNPNTDEKAEAPSKALNDPDYKPDVAPAPRASSGDDDKFDPVPPPGTMAQPPPENSESLPQQ